MLRCWSSRDGWMRVLYFLPPVESSFAEISVSNLLQDFACGSWRRRSDVWIRSARGVGFAGQALCARCGVTRGEGGRCAALYLLCRVISRIINGSVGMFSLSITFPDDLF